MSLVERRREGDYARGENGNGAGIFLNRGTGSDVRREPGSLLLDNGPNEASPATSAALGPLSITDAFALNVTPTLPQCSLSLVHTSPGFARKPKTVCGFQGPTDPIRIRP
ncbi:hypothetical protein SKAU_G00257110 [Synaphobranchus kaupii]|uniref:Uncharacterized protein n=1 Tax=Synaphobranchus kaupii TaxID=118154 RepID=A0A9Q1F431_SYNKA|nr:hypothetical protein SKAU_G00257110 [Synaphobranchus kaupii]